jgi:hypothetical protein
MSSFSRGDAARDTAVLYATVVAVAVDALDTILCMRVTRIQHSAKQW